MADSWIISDILKAQMATGQEMGEAVWWNNYYQFTIIFLHHLYYVYQLLLTSNSTDKHKQWSKLRWPAGMGGAEWVT